MNTIERLNNFKLNAISIIESAHYYMQSLQPLNSIEFMNPDERKTYDSYVELINRISEKYNELYGTLSEEEKKENDYMDIIVEFNTVLKSVPCIEMVTENDDEESIKEKFNKAYQFGMSALEEKVAAEKRGDKVTVLNCNRVLEACHMTFKKHPWGMEYQANLDQYEEGLRSGKVAVDNLLAYKDLYHEAVQVAIEYAKAMIEGRPYEEIAAIAKRFEPIYEKSDELLKKIPEESLKDINTNAIRHLKISVQSRPREFLEKSNSYLRVK